jgi:putative phage-type endonuclease
MNAIDAITEVQGQYTFVELEQGSLEWLLFRKTKVTATDASVIMGASHWKTKVQLYYEKISDHHQTFRNDRMQRGIDLEPLARHVFETQMEISVTPKVVVKDWAMASLDGISDDCKCVVEIKCPGERDHAVALAGKIPEHYYPQLQHQMWVCDVESMFYFSFDGFDGVCLGVSRNEKFIKKMIEQEKMFYDCLMSRTSPESSENDYIERNDELWKKCAEKWKYLNESLKRIEKEEEELRRQLIFLSGESNTRGAGISLCQVTRKGNVDYSAIPQIQNLDLDVYRKPSSNGWRISCI